MMRARMAIPAIKSIEPRVGLPGGLVRVGFSGVTAPEETSVFFDGEAASVLSASTDGALVRIPPGSGSCHVTIRGPGGESPPSAFVLGDVLAGDLNPVANPATDAEGNIFSAFSGQRGAAVPFSVYRIRAGSNEKEPYLADIVNATAVVAGPDGSLFISSRHTGIVYRADSKRRLETFAENLGIATGMALDRSGHLYVGDRAGTVHRITPEGKAMVLCEIEASVSAFHLAMRSDDTLFVSGPTLATQDNIYEVGKDGVPKVYFRGIGRPQGMTFDSSGRLLVTGSYRGRRGVFSVEPGRVRPVVASAMLVGVVERPNGELLLADSASLYAVPAGAWKSS